VVAGNPLGFFVSVPGRKKARTLLFCCLLRDGWRVLYFEARPGDFSLLWTSGCGESGRLREVGWAGVLKWAFFVKRGSYR
jgi:hypothetical protein